MNKRQSTNKTLLDEAKSNPVRDSDTFLISRRKLITGLAVFGLTFSTFGKFLATADAASAATRTSPATVTKAVTSKLYAASAKNNQIAVLDAKTNAVLRSIAMPAKPYGLAAVPSLNKIFVSSSQTSSISVIDTVSDKIISSIEVGKAPQGLALTPDGNLLVVAVNKANKVILINPATNNIVGQSAVNTPQEVVISPDGHTAFVTSRNHSQLAVIELASQTQTAVELNGVSRILSYQRGQTSVYFILLDTDSTQTYQTITTANLADRIEQDALMQVALNQLRPEFSLVTGKVSSELAIIDPKKGNIKRAVTVANSSNWKVLSVDGRTTYTSTENSGDVLVLDSANSERMVGTLLAADVQPLVLNF